MTLPARTQERINKMTGLIALLRERDITTEQAAEHLAMSAGGGKRYIRELRSAEIIVAIGSRNGRAGQPAPTYHLQADQAAIDKFVAAQCDAVAPKQAKAPRATLLGQALNDPTRHVHLMHDDAYHPPTMRRFKPFRDPLVSALFGAPGAHA